MLRMAAESGTTDIVGTPHANSEYEFQPDAIEDKIAELMAAVSGAIRVHRGCDFHLSYDNILDALANPTKYTINHKNYLLVEFSDLLIPKTTDEVFQRMLGAGMTPIITHPERNMLLQKRFEKLAEWAEAGCLLQVTGSSILGRFGKQAKAFSDLLLKHNLVHIVASDAHDTKYRPPVLSEAYEYVRKSSGYRTADRLFEKNPAATLTGEALPQPEEGEEEAGDTPKKWYRVWS
jgi:protein-tyrosine phosphatase